ncbi:uncharacterized protein FPRO_00906 [Fusarium proliferatum ET1]|uniref:Uncharacterized protein n=1 Tax=Fusarium proliferatum (strain ET1) TaxID=1227346 RepID=A0A1L7V237_FUSPR|nr:uncharacterized protein FPRO_00906 [Fusarium proliferatum ET1]CZR34973.1 uncharacterized protein FPRO_00906 [Fusarium proliferatum ET1]
MHYLALYRRTRACPVAGSPSGIWISNNLLAQAIDRCQRFDPIPSRCLSSYAGPLESRRRLGKRHIAAVVPNSHASPFPWRIEVPINLGEWTWEAPVAPNDRHKKKIGLFERFLRNLEDMGHEENTNLATATPPPEAVMVPMALTLTSIEQARGDMNERLAKFYKFEDENALKKICEPYVIRILKMIEERTISNDDLIQALDPFDNHLKQRAPAKVLDDRVAKQWVYIIHAMYRTRTTSTEDLYGSHVWHQCLKTILHMAPQPSTFHCLEELLRLIALYEKIQLDTSDYLDLLHSHNRLEMTQGEQHPTQPISFRLLRRSMQLTRLISARGLTQMETFEALTKHCFQFVDETTDQRTLAFQLLLKLAAVPGLKAGEFSTLAGNVHSIQDWVESEVWQFVAIRLMSTAQGGIRPEQLYKWITRPTQLHCWAAMLQDSRHSETKKRIANLRALTHTSETFGHLDTLIKSVRLVSDRHGVIQDMMKMEKDPYCAVMIWESYNAGAPVKHKFPWYMWARHAEAIVTHPDLPPDLIWQIAEFCSSKTATRLKAPIVRNLVFMMDFLEEICQFYMKKPGLTPRQRLRYIETAINWGKRTGQHMSQPAIQILAEILLQDLEEGKMGRKTRLRYLVKKIGHFYGKEQASKVAVSLDGWRWTNRRRGGELPRMPAPTREAHFKSEEPTKELPDYSVQPTLEESLKRPLRQAWEQTLPPIGGLRYDFESKDSREQDDNGVEDERTLEFIMRAQRRKEEANAGKGSSF